MISNRELQFLRKKITDLGTAVLYNHSTSVLKIPNTIISALHVDDVGQLWFFIKRPRQHINEFEKEFYANLDFLKKGKNFFIKVEGKATLITDPEDIYALIAFSDKAKEKAREEEVLVVMNISGIAYFEKRKRNTWINHLTGYISRLLHTRRPAYRVFHLNAPTGF